MAGKINLYNIGSLGVDLTRSVHHAEDGSWRQLQNAVPDHRGEFGGVSKRDGLTAVNSSGAGSSLMGAIDVPFPSISSRVFLLGLDSDQTDTFRTSTDAFATSSGTTTPSRVQEKGYVGNGMNPSLGRMIATSGNKLYYQKDGTKNIISWDGVEERLLVTVPNDSTYTVKWTHDLLIDGQYLYFITIDTEGFQSHRERVWQYNLATQGLLQLGQHFGNQGLGNNNSTAISLGLYQNMLFVGLGEVRNNDEANSQGRIYRIRPGVDSDWTLDHTAALNEWVTSLCSYGGLLYAGITNDETTGHGKVLVRGTNGSWTQSTITTGTADSPRNAFGSLIVFGSNLYAIRRMFNTVSDTTEIMKFDGSSWTSVHTYSQDYEPGPSLVHNGKLYMLSISNTKEAILAHTSNGTAWTEVTTGLSGDVMAAFSILVV